MRKALIFLAVVAAMVAFVGCEQKPMDNAVLTSIKVGGDYKRTYLIGESFDRQGMVVTALYDDGSSRVVTNFEFDDSALEFGQDWVRIEYTEDGKTASAWIEISVRAPFGISVADPNFTTGTLFRFCVEFDDTVIFSIREFTSPGEYPYGEINPDKLDRGTDQNGFPIYINPMRTPLSKYETFTFLSFGKRLADIDRIELHYYIGEDAYSYVFKGSR